MLCGLALDLLHIETVNCDSCVVMDVSSTSACETFSEGNLTIYH